MNRMDWNRLAIVAGGLGLLPLTSAQGQGPAASAPTAAPSVSTGILFACFVPSSGTVYRIKEPGLPDSCRGQGVEFSWNAEGPAGPQGPPGPGADPAALTTLQNNINAEASARQAADATLQGNIDNEAAARAAGDAATLASANVYTDAHSGGGAVAAEAAARQAADFTLQSNIDAEAAARAAGDTQLQTNINNEAAARQAADVTLQNNIDAEAAARAAGDAQLQMNINDETTVRQAADNTLQNNINAEAIARVAGDTPAIVALTPAAGWSNYGAGYAPVTSAKSGGVVTVTGLLAGSGVGVVLTLPLGHRPAQAMIFTTSTASGAARVDVASNGDVFATSGVTAWLSLSGISFPAP